LLIKLGFDEELARQAVIMHNGDTKTAINYAINVKKNIKK
jgi:uncharacterized UBP type Zn finger protein